MKSISIGNRLIDPPGRELIVIEWKPNAGFLIKGKWLLRDNRGITCQLSTEELTERGYRHKEV